MTAPKEAVLINKLRVEPHGPANDKYLKAADINDDGKMEMVMLKNPGQFKSRLYSGRDDLDDPDRNAHCLTAVSHTGEVLWQDGEPYEGEHPLTSHGRVPTFQVDDIDRDGRIEVVVIRGSELVVLDAATGVEKRAVELPADNYLQVYTAQLSPPEKGRQIIVKVNDRAYDRWMYANPLMIYNCDLSVYYGPFEVENAGHNMVVMDVDDCGRDELLIGYSLFDHRLNEIWTLDLPPDVDHADHIAVSDINGDGSPEIRYSGSEDLYVASIQGKLLWQTQAGHSQRTAEGPWGAGGERRIIMSEKWRGLWGLDTLGQVLWNRTDLNGYAVGNVRWQREGQRTAWALYQPRLKPVEDIPYKSDPDWCRGLWPRFIDGDGELLEVFPWREEYKQPAQLIRAKRSYDCGVGYNVLIKDVNDDGLDEVIIYDRRRIWIFKSPEAEECKN